MYAYAGNNPVRYIDPDGNEHGIPIEFENTIKTMPHKESQIPFYEQQISSAIRNLEQNQNFVMSSSDYEPGGKGPYGYGGGTFCNFATYNVIRGTNPQFLSAMLNEGDFTGQNTRAKDAGINLQTISANGDSTIKEITGGSAQHFANKGYTVVGVIVDGFDSHICTIRPGWQYFTEKGPMTANVGIREGTRVQRAASSFADDFSNGSVKYFYDASQKIGE